MAWELAKADTLGDYPKTAAKAIDMTFETVVKAIAPEIAQDAVTIKAGIR